jgi:hypothetical protein
MFYSRGMLIRTAQWNEQEVQRKYTTDAFGRKKLNVKSPYAPLNARDGPSSPTSAQTSLSAPNLMQSLSRSNSLGFLHTLTLTRSAMWMRVFLHTQ